MFAEDPEPSVETSRSPEWSWWYRWKSAESPSVETSRYSSEWRWWYRWKSVETRTHSEWRGWYR